MKDTTTWGPVIERHREELPVKQNLVIEFKVNGKVCPVRYDNIEKRVTFFLPDEYFDKECVTIKPTFFNYAKLMRWVNENTIGKSVRKDEARVG